MRTFALAAGIVAVLCGTPASAQFFTLQSDTNSTLSSEEKALIAKCTEKPGAFSFGVITFHQDGTGVLIWNYIDKLSGNMHPHVVDLRWTVEHGINSNGKRSTNLCIPMPDGGKTCYSLFIGSDGECYRHFHGWFYSMRAAGGKRTKHLP